MKKDGTIEIKGMTITIEGQQNASTSRAIPAPRCECSGRSVKMDPATLTANSTLSALKGTAQVQVQGAAVQIQGQAEVQVSGPMIMIG